MSKSDFEDILRRYLEGNTNAEETAHVEKWYEGIEEINSTSIEHPEKLKNEIFKKIHSYMDGQQTGAGRMGKVVRWSMRIAASILLLLTAAGIYYYVFNSPAEQATTLVPGTDKAILKLADGTILELDSKNIGDLANEGGANIAKLDSGTVAYTESDASEPVKYNEIQTPTGGQFVLKLPDGTKMWINSVSTVRFPTRFTGNERRVTVTGEAYFEVAHNEKMPFIVEVPGKQEITVLGTHFNVSAYSDEATVKTTLAQGRVRVDVLENKTRKEDVILKPGQQAVLTSGKSIEMKDRVDLDEVLAWKDGYFIFNQTQINDIARQFSRWYGAKVIVDPRASNQTFTGRITRGTEIQKVMKILEATNTVSYSLEGNQIKIYLKK